MSPRITIAVTLRILRQLHHDRRTIAMLLFVPTILLALLYWVFEGNEKVFDSIGGPMLGIFPFVTMFLVTSIATLRERTNGTLERLMAMPTHKLDILFGYAIAFSLIAVLQVGIASFVASYWLDLDITGSLSWLFVVALVDAWLGIALGLFVSAFARTEFQAVQFMPVVVLPQFLLCGLLAPRDQMNEVLYRISDFLPLSYAIDAVKHITVSSDIDETFIRNILIVVGFSIVVLILGAMTLRRRTD